MAGLCDLLRIRCFMEWSDGPPANGYFVCWVAVLRRMFRARATAHSPARSALVGAGGRCPATWEGSAPRSPRRGRHRKERSALRGCSGYLTLLALGTTAVARAGHLFVWTVLAHS